MSIGKEALLLFAVMFLPGFVTQGGVVDPSGWNSVDFNVALLAVAIPQILLVVYLTELRTPGFPRRIGWKPLRPAEFVNILLSAGALFGSLALLGLLVSLVARDTGLLEPAVSWSFSRLEILPLVILSSVAVGYREEIFYRAYVITRGEELGVHRLLLVTGPSLLFAAGHLYQGWIGFIVALVIGLVLAALFLWRRSLHGVAIAHGLYNVAILLVSSTR